MSTIFSLNTNTGYKVAIGKPVEGGSIPLRIERKVALGVVESIQVCLSPVDASMLASMLDDAAVKGYAVQIGAV